MSLLGQGMTQRHYGTLMQNERFAAQPNWATYMPNLAKDHTFKALEATLFEVSEPQTRSRCGWLC